MPSATSFFNGTLYRRNLSRFWPLWALYGVIWLYILPLSLLNQVLNARFHSDPVSLVQYIPVTLSMVGTGTALVFGLFSAMAVFSYLYSARSACAMHALPLRREALFLTSWLSGLSFLLLPNLLIVFLTLLVGLLGASMAALAHMLLIWFLAQSALCLFFYSFAAFCAMFTGSILALPVFYGILNGLAPGLLFLMENTCREIFFGFSSFESSTYRLVEYLTPVLMLSHACTWSVRTDVPGDTAPSLYSPALLAGYSIVALVLTVLALEVYRTRHVETAGDVISVPLIRPVFRYGFAFCTGLSFGVVTATFFGAWDSPVIVAIFILLWTVIGCFVGEMFLRRSFRVLHAWKGTAVMTVIMAVLCVSCVMDWFGYSTRVPDLSEVESVSMNCPDSAPFDTAYNNRKMTLTDPEEISSLLQLHRAFVEEGDSSMNSFDSRFELNLTYTLKNGSTMTRYYAGRCNTEDLQKTGSVTWAAQQLLENRDLVEKAYGFDVLETRGRLVSACLVSLWDPATEQSSDCYLENASPADLNELWAAVRADFDDGTIGVRYLFPNSEQRTAGTYVTDLRFEFSFSDSSDSKVRQETIPSHLQITLTPTASRTLAWLNRHGALTENRELMTWDEYYSAHG